MTPGFSGALGLGVQHCPGSCQPCLSLPSEGLELYGHRAGRASGSLQYHLSGLGVPRDGCPRGILLSGLLCGLWYGPGR